MIIAYLYLFILKLCISISREGSLKTGDRILTVNDFSVLSLNLTEIYMLLSQCDNIADLILKLCISIF